MDERLDMKGSGTAQDEIQLITGENIVPTCVHVNRITLSAVVLWSVFESFCDVFRCL